MFVSASGAVRIDVLIEGSLVYLPPRRWFGGVVHFRVLLGDLGRRRRILRLIFYLRLFFYVRAVIAVAAVVLTVRLAGVVRRRLASAR